MNKKVKRFIHILVLTAVLGFAGYFFNSAEAATTDSVSGYAWSENIGWINLAPAGPYPDAPNNSAEYNSGSGEVRGWARAESNGNGWDGWILFGQPSGWIDQVSIESGTGEFAGWAWGGGVAACSDCDSRFVNVTGDTITGSLTVNNTMTVDGDLRADNNTWGTRRAILVPNQYGTYMCPSNTYMAGIQGALYDFGTDGVKVMGLECREL